MESDIKVNGIKFSDNVRLAAHKRIAWGCVCVCGGGLVMVLRGEERFRLKRTVSFMDLNRRRIPPQGFRL